jgi:hypothetical protein
VALCGHLNRSGGRKGTPWAPSFTHNSYSICPSWYESIKGWCGLEFTIDAFASAKAKVLPRFWDRRQDAFKKSWSKEILWINPPLGRTEDIVTKAGKDRAQGLMLVPLQTNQPWFRALRRIAVTWWDLPMGAVLFQDDDGVPCEGQDQGWRWRAVVFDGIVLDYDPPPRGKWEETVGLLPTMEEMSLLDEQYMIEESGLEYEETRVQGASEDIDARSRSERASVRAIIETELSEDPRVQTVRDRILSDYEDVATDKKEAREIDPANRGPFGTAKIELLPGAVPKKDRPFRLVGERATALADKVKEFEERGWIEEAPASEWAARAFVVPKPTPGEYRMVIDYRYLNECTKVDSFPLPIIEDCIAMQSRCRMWTIADAADGFHQMPRASAT